MTVIRSPISPVIFSHLRAPTALYKGGGVLPTFAEWVAREFGNGEVGAAFDHQDITTYYTDTGLTTQAGVGDLVAAQRDISGNGYHRTEATSGLRPTLRQRADGKLYLDYSDNRRLRILNVTTAFKFLHDGTGGSTAAFIEWPRSGSTSTYARTISATSQVGFYIRKSAGGIVDNLICRGTSGVLTAGATIDQFSQSGELAFLHTGYKNDGGADDIVIAKNNGLTEYVGATLNSPSTSASALTFECPDTTFLGNEYGLVVINRKWTAEAVAELYAIWRDAADYSVPAVDLTIATVGQSNLSGRGSMATSGETPAVGTYIYDKAEEYRLAFEPSHSIINQPVATDPTEPSLTTPNYAFATKAGKAIKTDADATTLWVPCAVGSTSIALWDTPSTRDDRTTLFGAFKYRFQRALEAKGGTPVIILDGFEGSASLPVEDFTNGGVGTAYQTAMSSLINNIRTYVSDCPIIMRQLAADDTLADAEAFAAVGEAQRQLELSTDRLYMIVSHDLARNASTDDIHLSRAGQEALATRVALAIREHVLEEAVNGTGPRLVAATYADDTITVAFDSAVNESLTDYGDLFRVYENGVELTVSSATRNADTSKIDIVVVPAPVADDSFAVDLGVYTAKNDGGAGETVEQSSGSLRVVGATASVYPLAERTLEDLVVGAEYMVLTTITRASALDAAARIRVDASPITTLGIRNLSVNSAGTTSHSFAFTATATTMYLAAGNQDGVGENLFDEITVRGPLSLTYGYRAGPASAARTDMVTDSDGLPLPTFGPILVPAA